MPSEILVLHPWVCLAIRGRNCWDKGTQRVRCTTIDSIRDERWVGVIFTHLLYPARIPAMSEDDFDLAISTEYILNGRFQETWRGVLRDRGTGGARIVCAG